VNTARGILVGLTGPGRESGAHKGPLTCSFAERATRFELATLTLAR
jgi:hypothetical protein